MASLHLSKSEMDMNEAFLDSTAVAARVMEDSDALPLLVQTLESYGSRLTSQYVLMEIRRGLIRNLAFLYNCAENATEFSQVLEKVETLLSTPRRHLPRTIVQNLRSFFQSIQNEKLVNLAAGDSNATLSEYQLRALTSLLRLRIRNWLRNVTSLVDHLVNDFNCYPDLPPIKQVGNRFDAGMPFCESLSNQCQIAEFLLEHRPDIEKILLACSLACRDKETEDRIRALGTVLVNPEAARSHKVCWDLGDVIICLEAPALSDIINNNARHMDEICAAIGKKSIHWR